ncbi:MAG TPA: thioredoxin domain-containing protein [Kofleriaceae bacterium]|nr:thioredoxin domain-containing protein [Kofleriaceae bacterium]
MARCQILSLAALALCAAGLGAAAAQGEPGFDASARYRIPLDGAPSRGARDALVTIVEFSDFNCRYCRVANGTIAELLRLYPREVRVVYRHSLLDPEDGTLAAEAAMAAAEQGRFWPYHDRLFASSGGLDRATLEAYAREVGLDLERFRRDLDSGRFRAAVREQDLRAAELGVRATPAFFVNGRPLLGAHGLGTFIALIEEERAAAEALVARGVARSDVYHRVTGRGLPRAAPVPEGADMPAIPRIDEGARYPVGLGEASHRRGRDDALVTIVEFGDFTCGFCARVQPTLRALERRYGDDLRIVYRHMPLGNRPESRLIAEAAAAAGEQGRFWDMHDRLFSARRPLDRPALEAIAGELGLDLARFRAALDQGRFAGLVSADAAVAARLGLRGTPAFFINGAPLMGARPIEELAAAIDAELARARELLARGVPRAELYRAATSSGP